MVPCDPNQRKGCNRGITHILLRKLNVILLILLDGIKKKEKY